MTEDEEYFEGHEYANYPRPNMETTEEKKLPKHLQAAVNHMEKQITKLLVERKKELHKQAVAGMEIDSIDRAVESIQRQIDILKAD